MNFTRIPDPDTLSPERKKAMLAQPWFQQLMMLDDMGVDITPDLMRSLATTPMGMGISTYSVDAGNGQKGVVFYDMSTGKRVSPEEIRWPDFSPTIKTLKDPETGRPMGKALMTSRNSAVPFEGQDNESKLNPSFKLGIPHYDPDTKKLIGREILMGDGKRQFVKEGSGDFAEMAALIAGLRGDGTKPPTQPAPASATPQPVMPQQSPTATTAPSAAPDGSPFYTITNDDDFYNVPKGAWFKTPDGRMLQKLKEVQKPQPAR